ncbi:MAG TPA: Asp-tRNA(Asn)/Glu-tRNA(Gln) amidotransferase subunit GatC [Candidatus Paceibacterota bacterium]|nr:Asp-tRNA(Asn)/Glu-tRNA(Gln) amidotransferase subunit GatC [Candidatus Paceibacterota bacterium]
MISKEEVKHLAKLTQLELSSEELEKMAKELDLILNYVDKLNEVDVSDVLPLTGGHNLSNVFREDDLLEFNFDRNLLFQKAEFENRFLKVKRIIDK